MMPCYKVPFGTLSILAILLFSACSTSPSRSITPEIVPQTTIDQQLQYALNSAREQSAIKGVSAAIIRPHKEIWIGVSGMSDPTIDEQIVPEMLFDIGSIGKNYLAALVLRLVEERRLGLDDPLWKWLPNYPNIDNKITIRQLLNHTSGVFDFVKHPRSPFQMVYRSTKIWNQEQILAELVDKPYFIPGKGWHYSTTNYILLRMIAEKVTGSKVSSETARRFLIPLALDGTVAVDPLGSVPAEIRIANNWIGQHVDLAPKPQPWTSSSPTLIYATAEDAAKWAHFLYHDKIVLKQRSLDQMLDFHSPAPNDPPLSGYGLGVMFVDYDLVENLFGIKGVRMWGHGGSTHGFRSIVMYLPDQETTISVLANGNDDKGLINIFVGLLKVIIDDSNKE
ncbi:MAG: beta-lactamase family protein [Desulfobacteraceae bacterium]|nr:beta-lactamase family protein [Desulfobacteraceae bacterium]